ncbi:TetR/AcrR family transcriptional regulator [Gordonia sp. (in: high G+C Gram-positive bacteria)]|uniref:TetR/AcrR family transcriptional regulator n=1 Tax=Gordonia sp. (in: high G+C Gram-positive bacteria) TaxID=84139 RepID=UPI0016BA967E|nr:TetR/AcrR family transcriptional regulator [Gordonia sp. (in: high G+C Gram-positive bacteria)]NLG45658.1 TetR/AcrR family transcriptional regulator [Gordonia sp. (in: high G+C Gram-positive bacteria)]
MTPPEGGSRPGGRSARVRRAVVDAAAELFAEHGIENVTIPAIAKRSGVHETTIYRRWGDRDNLALDVLLSMAKDAVPIPDTGDLRSDLIALVEATMARLQSPIGLALARLSVQASGSPRLAEQRHSYWTAQVARAGELITRAVARGELPEDTPVQLTLELMIAPLYMRLLVTGEPLDPSLPRQIVDLALLRLTAATAPASAERS